VSVWFRPANTAQKWALEFTPHLQAGVCRRYLAFAHRAYSQYLVHRIKSTTHIGESSVRFWDMFDHK